MPRQSCRRMAYTEVPKPPPGAAKFEDADWIVLDQGKRRWRFKKTEAEPKLMFFCRYRKNHQTADLPWLEAWARPQAGA